MNYKQILTITHKPTLQEYKTTLKITAIGITIIGLIGMTLTITKVLI